MTDAFLEWLLATAALPKVGLPTVFVVAFVSATLLPMGSEPVVFGYVKLQPEMFWITVCLATVGNTLGGMVNYWLGYGAREAFAKDRHTPRALAWLERLGPKACFFAFLPGVGDPLTAVAGWVELPWRPVLLWQAAGKFTRYAVLTALLLWVPDSFWNGLLAPLRHLLMHG
jgi:membrane protein YqaA with SNARE-associated domain